MNSNLLDCINLMIDICDRVLSLNSDRSAVLQNDQIKIKIAVDTAEEIITLYSAVQRNIDIDIRETARVYSERREVGDRDVSTIKSRSSYYRYWSTFSPDIAIGALNILVKTCDRQFSKQINRLSEIVKPWRVHKPPVTARSLELKRYKFSSYAQWVQTFSDHQLPYKQWVVSGLYDATEPMQDIDRFFAAELDQDEPEENFDIAEVSNQDRQEFPLTEENKAIIFAIAKLDPPRKRWSHLHRIAFNEIESFINGGEYADSRRAYESALLLITEKFTPWEKEEIKKISLGERGTIVEKKEIVAALNTIPYPTAWALVSCKWETVVSHIIEKKVKVKNVINSLDYVWGEYPDFYQETIYQSIRSRLLTLH